MRTENNTQTHHLLSGTVLLERYIIEEVIGEGGFGITYMGRDNTNDLKVAVKEYFPKVCVSRNGCMSSYVNCSSVGECKEVFEKGKSRFKREAGILSKFSGSPGIVNILDYFEENNTIYIVMEYLEGKTLKQHIDEQGVLPVENIVKLMLPLMKSLNCIHKNDVIHRDISPDNIILSDNTAKLIDFGVACSISAQSISVTLKPGYAPEEQYRRDGHQGSWTDVYGLSATMYKCITGITPDDSISRIFCDELKKPSELGIKIPKTIENAILKGLSVTKKERFQSFEEMVCIFQDSNY